MEPILKKIGPTLKLSIFEETKAPLTQPRLLMTTLGEKLGREVASTLEQANSPQACVTN